MLTPDRCISTAWTFTWYMLFFITPSIVSNFWGAVQINLNKYTMTKNMTEKVTIAYESPNCDIVDIKAEGVLCASMQQLEEDENEYAW